MEKHKIARNAGLTLLSEGKTLRIKAHGYSMFPRIKPGSLIKIEPIQIKGPPVPGEIIAISAENGIIIHRLVKIVIKNNIKYFIARGDSNAWPDQPVKYDRIAGRVVGAETTGENPETADIKINTSPGYFINRIRLILLLLWKRFKKQEWRKLNRK